MKTKKTKISDKNRLIKKFWENALAEAYKKAPGSKQRGRGIYVLYSKGKIYYIGLSKRSLRGRLRGHALRDRHKGKWDSFSFYRIGKTKYIKDIESLLLRVFRPPGNRVAGKFGRKYNLAKIMAKLDEPKVIRRVIRRSRKRLLPQRRATRPR
jgi:hypothetical protein